MAKILYVEDEFRLVGFIFTLLSEHEVLLAFDFWSALDKLKKNPDIEMVITDIDLKPDVQGAKNGVDLADLLRLGQPDLPCVILSWGPQRGLERAHISFHKRVLGLAGTHFPSIVRVILDNWAEQSRKMWSLLPKE